MRKKWFRREGGANKKIENKKKNRRNLALGKIYALNK